MTEAQLQAAVLELCSRLGYAVAHFGPAMTGAGNWITAGTSGATGFPDLVICGRGRLLFAELKSAKGKPAERQLMWLDRLRKAGCETHVWRPADWADGTIEMTLKQGGK